MVHSFSTSPWKVEAADLREFRDSLVCPEFQASYSYSETLFQKKNKQKNKNLIISILQIRSQKASKIKWWALDCTSNKL